MNYENKRKFTMSKAHKSKLYKVIAVTSAMAMICGMSACAKKSAVDSETTKIDYVVAEIDYAAAEKEFIEYLKEDKCFCSEIDGRYDVTGDGYDDLYAGYLWGSGMPRDVLTFYDPVNHQVYNVHEADDESAFPYDYHVVSCDDKGLTVSRNPFNDHEEVVLGTVKLIDGEVIFVEN